MLQNSLNSNIKKIQHENLAIEQSQQRLCSTMDDKAHIRCFYIISVLTGISQLLWHSDKKSAQYEWYLGMGLEDELFSKPEV